MGAIRLSTIAKPRNLILVVLLFAICPYAGHIVLLDRRSKGLEARVIATVLPERGMVGLISLLAPDDFDISKICIMTPYSSAPDDIDVGVDRWWLQSVDEGTIGIVALNDSNQASGIWRLSRARLDITDSGQCLGKDDEPMIKLTGHREDGIPVFTVDKKNWLR